VCEGVCFDTITDNIIIGINKHDVIVKEPRIDDSTLVGQT
jgi:hypothetical protein